MIQKPGDPPSIVDGQQRIATISILLARMRDHLRAIKRDAAADFVEETFLSNIDLKSEKRVPRLKLNLEDNEFFASQTLPTPTEGTKKKAAPGKPSNRRLLRASELSQGVVSDAVKNLSADAQAEVMIKWVSYIEKIASVLVVRVPDDVSAFRMFETLNDRGLKASQADILKNFFLSRIGNDRLVEAQMM